MLKFIRHNFPSRALSNPRIFRAGIHSLLETILDSNLNDEKEKIKKLIYFPFYEN